MTIASAIENARNKIATAYQTVENMGGTLPTTQNLENLPIAIESVNTTGSLIDGSATEVDTSVSSIRGSAFANCTNLNKVILRSNTVVDLSDDTIFENTPIASGEGNIYVPDGLVKNYLIDGWNTSLSQSSDSWRNITAFSDGIIALAERGVTKILQNGSTTWTDGGSLPQLKNDDNWQFIYEDPSGRLFAISYNGYSSNSVNGGSTWSPRTPVSQLQNGFWQACCLNNFEDRVLIVLISQFGTIACIDGTNWSYSSLGEGGGNAGWFDLTFDGNKFIALSDMGYLSTSTDGINWTQATQNNTLRVYNCRGITYKKGLYIVITYQGKVLTSLDCINFSEDTSLTNFSNGYAITFDDDNVFVLNRQGTIMKANSLPYDIMPISSLPS